MATDFEEARNGFIAFTAIAGAIIIASLVATKSQIVNNTNSSVQEVSSLTNDLADNPDDATDLAIYQQVAKAVTEGTVTLGPYRLSKHPKSEGFVTALPTAQKCGELAISNDVRPQSDIPVPDLAGAAHYPLCIGSVKVTYMPKPAG